MKILQVVPYFPPAFSFGGPVKIAYQIARELVKKDHKVEVYTSDAKNLSSRLNINPVIIVDGIKVNYFRNLSLIPVKMSKIFITPHIILKAMEEIKKFDVIHLHESRTFQNIILHHYAKKHRIPYILQAHGSLPWLIGKKRSKSIYDRLFGYKIVRDASRVVALTEVEAKQYEEIGFPKDKIAVIPNGINLLEFTDLPSNGIFRAKYGISNNKKIILYLGRIHKIKGIDLLIKAFASLVRNKNFNDVLLVIVGPDDGYLKEVKSMVKSFKINDNVLFTGPLYDREKLEAYVDAEIYVLPSRYETFPMTVLESMACETPIILSKNCGIEKIINDNTGVVVTPSPEGIQVALLKLLSDENLQKKFKENCRSTLKQFDITNIASKLEKVYEETIEENKLKP